MDAPLENLTRTVEFELRDGPAGDGNTLEGYAAVFDSETVIDSWEGNFVEKIARGAFKKTIRERTPVVQFDHGRHPLVGSIPIAEPPALSEDDRGLFISAPLHDNWLVQPVRDAIKSKAIPGMSFRFTVTKEMWQEPADSKSLPVRTIQEVKLFELGPVVFPAYEGTTVGVRSQVAALVDDPAALAELARVLVLGTADAAADKSEPREHSDRTARPEAAGDGTSGERSETEHTEPPPAEAAAGTSDEHSEPTHSPAVRASMPEERRRRDLSEIRQLAAAAASKEI